MKLQQNILYKAKIKNVQFGNIPKEHLINVLSSGRLCGVLLESEISSLFDGVVEGTQGNAPDFICESLGTIQAKTYHSSNFQGNFKSGPRKGLPKADSKAIFTTKSGLWDSMKRRRALGEDVDAMITDYYDQYDKFCYIDISNMKNLEYSFIIVDSNLPKEKSIDGNISLNDIMDSVESIQIIE